MFVGAGCLKQVMEMATPHSFMHNEVNCIYLYKNIMKVMFGQNIILLVSDKACDQR